METKINNDLKVFEALNLLRKSRPHLFSLLDLVNIEADCADIPTACVSWDKRQKRFLIKVGQNFSENLDAKNFSGVLEHELLHVLFEHLFDETMPNKMLANIAMDSIINDSIEIFKSDKADELLDSRVKLKKISKDFDISKTTSLEVYKFLEKQSEEAKKEIMKGLGDGGQGIDSHEGFSNNDDTADGAENSTLSDSLEREIARASLKNHIEKNLEKFQGTGNAEIDRIVTELIKVEYNFKTLFSVAVKKTLKEELKRSWKRLSRRLPNIIKGKTKNNVPKVLLVVDTSGSINDDILAKVNWQLDFLAKHYSFTVCWGDTKLEDFKEIKKGQKPKIEYSGFGGTNLNFYLDLHEKNNYDLIIFNTDGYIPPMPLDCKAQKIFCIYEGGIEVKGYKNIMLK